MRKFIDRVLVEISALPITTRPDVLWCLRGAAWYFAGILIADHPLAKGGLSPMGRRYFNFFCRGYSIARRTCVVGATNADWQHALRRHAVIDICATSTHLLNNAKN